MKRISITRKWTVIAEMSEKINERETRIETRIKVPEVMKKEK